jgi:integrase
MIATTADTFDTVDCWIENPVVAYSSFLNTKNYEESTSTVYITMFKSFCRWLSTKNIRLIDCNENNIEEFLREAELEKEHRQRYVLQLERVFDHLFQLDQSLLHNPGRQAGYLKLGKGDNAPTFFLNKSERTCLRDHLVKMGEDVWSCAEKSPDEWSRLRDLALVGVLFGGGVKVGEVERMPVNCIRMPDGWINVPRTAKVPAHRCQLLPFARAIVDAWLTCRGRLGIHGDALFIGRKKGRNTLPGQPLHATSIFRRVQAVLTSIGIALPKDADGAPAGRLCAQTLRNSFAAELFDAGGNEEQTLSLVASSLGLADTTSALRLRSSYLASIGEVAPPRTANV